LRSAPPNLPLQRGGRTSNFGTSYGDRPLFRRQKSGTVPVVHIITKLELGGAQQNTLFTVSHLDRARFRPILITGEAGLLDDEARQLPGVEFHQVPELVRPIRPLADVRALYRLTRLLRQLKPRVVHTHSSKAGILGRCAAYLAGVPIIIHSIHGFGFTPADHPVWRRVLIAVERVVGCVTTRFFAVSEANRQAGIALGFFSPDHCTLIRSGIDLQAFRHTQIDVEKKRRELDLEPEHPVIGMIAPLKPQKAPLDYVRLAALVHQANPEAQFLLVGDGELRPDVEAAIQQMGIGDVFRLLGWRRDVPEVLRCLDVLVLTSRWEGLPRVYLEALSSGVPIVGTNVDGADEVIRDGLNGYLRKPGDVQGMADAVLELLTHPEQARLMGRRGQAVAEEFDVHVMLRRQEAEYEALLARLQ
jgi:glycosyltransferase involved in cell wall biosynthesis